MQTYIPNTDVVVTTTLVDSADVPLSPVTVQYRVVDQTGNVIVAQVAVPSYLAGESEVSVTIPAVSNALTGAAVSALRIVEFYSTLEIGTLVQEVTYKVALLDPLIVPTTSFQTYNEAVHTASQLADIDGWVAASKEDQISALNEARDRLCLMVFSQHVYSDIDRQGHLSFDNFSLSDMDATSFAELDADFKLSLQKAQVIEADAVLVGDEVGAKREGGIMSETIGESSMMFRAGRPAKYPLSKRTMKLLSRYLRMSRVIGRA